MMTFPENQRKRLKHLNYDRGVIEKRINELKRYLKLRIENNVIHPTSTIQLITVYQIDLEEIKTEISALLI